MLKLKLSSIKKIENDCKKILDNSRRNISEDTGWHQHLGTDKLGIIATSMALICYKEFYNIDLDSKDNCLKYIKEQQKEDGGWTFATNMGTSNVMATCWAIRALYLYEKDKNSESIRKAVDWLFSKKEKNRHHDSGWSLYGEGEALTYVTCFVILTLKKIGYDEKNNLEIESAVNWLKLKKSTEGYWKNSENTSFPSLFQTAMAVICLSETNKEKYSLDINTAITWMTKQIKHDGIESPKYECDLELVEENVGGQPTRMNYYHFLLPYIVIALLKNRKNYDLSLKCLDLLIKRNKNGYWEHPFILNNNIIPIWPIYDTIWAFHEIKKIFPPVTKKLVFNTAYYLGTEKKLFKVPSIVMLWLWSGLIDFIICPLVKIGMPIGVIIFVIVVCLDNNFDISNLLDSIKSAIGTEQRNDILSSIIAAVIYDWLKNIHKKIHHK